MNNLLKNANNYSNYLEFMEVTMKRREFYEEEKIKRYIYVFSITLILSVIIFLTIFVMYNKKLIGSCYTKGVLYDYSSQEY